MQTPERWEAIALDCCCVRQAWTSLPGVATQRRCNSRLRPLACSLSALLCHPPKQALAALQQLHEYEAAMGAGEEAEEAAQAEEGPEAAQAGGPAVAGEPMHKSRSQHATAVLAQNLAELAAAELAAPPEAAPNGVEP